MKRFSVSLIFLVAILSMSGVLPDAGNQPWDPRQSSHAPAPVATGTPFAGVPTGPTSSPAAAPPIAPVSRAGILRDPRGLLLTINDQPVVITGMNYNVNYTRLPDQTKQSLHRRDFQILKNAGVNAIVGWGIYDEVTLDTAYGFGVGVIMPFDLDPQGAYDNPNYRDQVKTEFRAFVERFKGYPAVWAWNPGGDELLYRMDTEQHRTTDKLQAAADFLVELATLAYNLDPNHLSVIKEPRDFYIPYLDVAMHKALAIPQQPDPHSFMVFGLNVYGHPDDVTEAVLAGKRNAEDRLGIPLLVTEFAPFGLPSADRAANYVAIWDAIRADSPNGGMAYCFGPDQPNPKMPNPYDPLQLLPNEFSFVDHDGKPVDGALDALANRYRIVRGMASSH